MAIPTLSCPNLGLNYISDIKNNNFKGWEETLIERLVSNRSLTWSKAPLRTFKNSEVSQRFMGALDWGEVCSLHCLG